MSPSLNIAMIELDFPVLGYVFLFAIRLNKKWNDFGMESAKLNSRLLLILSGHFALFVSRLNIEVFMSAREKKKLFWAIFPIVFVVILRKY